MLGSVLTSTVQASADDSGYHSSPDDSRAVVGTTEQAAQAACLSIGATVGLSGSDGFKTGQTGTSSNGLISWSIGSSDSLPYFPSESSYQGSLPYQNVSFTVDPSVKVVGVVVSGGGSGGGGINYNFYTSPAGLPGGSNGGNYYAPINNGGNIANISGFWVCVDGSNPPPLPTTPTLKTTPTVNGTSAYDTATVSGTSGTPTGSVTFALYTSGGMLVSGYRTNTVNLNGGTATSATATGLSPGSYYFLVTYSGDATYSAVTPGTPENFSVGQVSASLVTTPSVNGTSATDFATVSGTSGTPTGSVTFALYTSGGTLVPGYTTNTIGLIGGTATSATATGLSPGSYYFLVTYSGDATYSAVTPGTPEPFKIGQLAASLVTTPSVNGSSATDFATVSGTSGTPTGSVTFSLYAGIAPNGTLVPGYTTNTVNLIGGTATSATATGLSPGSYYFMVTYSGDATYSAIMPGSPESFSLGTPPPPPPGNSLVTTPSVNGTSATDLATVTGTSGTPTGSVTFSLYSGVWPNGTLVSGYTTNTVNLIGGTATSATATGLSPGSYYFMVTYSGDAVYQPVSPGSPEPFFVKATPSLNTTPSVTNQSASDSAIVTGTLGTPTGTVTFTLYSGTSPNGTLVTGFPADTVTLVNGQAGSIPTDTLSPGSYYFMVSYSGDANYSAVTPGTPEPFTIVKPTGIKVNPPKVPKVIIPVKAPKTGMGGSAQSADNGAVLAVGGLLIFMGVLGLMWAERRRRA